MYGIIHSSVFKIHINTLVKRKSMICGISNGICFMTIKQKNEIRVG